MKRIDAVHLIEALVSRVRRRIVPLTILYIVLGLFSFASSAAAAISYVQGNFATPQSSQSTVAVTFTGAQTGGDFNVVVVGWNDSTAAVSSVTDSSGNVYTRAVGPTAISGVASQSIYYAPNIKSAAAGGNVVTVVFTTAASFADIRILEYSGISATAPVDVTAAATGSSATSNSGAATTTNASDLIFGANLVTGATSGPGTGFTRRLLTLPDADIAEDKLVTATGSNSATAPSSGQWVMQMVAFKAAGTGTGVAPAINSGASATFSVGVAGSFTVTTTGTPTPSLSETGTLPSGVTFKDNGNGTATLAGTPAAGTAASYSLTITAANGVGTNATQSFTLTVNQAPAITSASSTTFTAGTAGSFTVTATGTPTPTLSETGALPSGITFANNANGTATLSGTPATGTGGNYPLTVTATNGVGTNATQSFTLTVNQSPAITSANSTTFTVGTGGTFTVTTTGTPASTLSEAGALPSGVTFKSNGNGTATLSGTPSAGTGGSYPFTIMAANGVGTNATQGFTLTVNQAPAITSANSTTFTVGTAGTFTVTTTGAPTPALSESGTLPTGVTFTNNSNGTATLAGTPGAGTAGSYPFTITASNAVGTNATQSFTLTVSPSSQAPAITSASSTTFTVGVVGTFTVTTTGSPAPALSESGALPTGVTFTNNSNGTATLAGTPGAGTAGTYPFTITAANGVGTNATQSFTLTVNQAPAITSASSTTFTVGTAGTFTVTATGSPTPSLSESGALPTGVTFINNSNGTATLAGTPGAGTAGNYPFTITAANGVGANATQSFTLTVNASNQAPAITSAAATTFVVGGAGSFTVTTTGTPTPAVTESGTLPTGVTFTSNANGTATLSGTPASGTAGSYPLTITASNGVGTAATQSFTLNVTAPAVIAYVQGNYATPQATTATVSVTYTAAQGAADLNVIVVGWNDSTAVVSSVTDKSGNVYTRAVGPTAISGVASQSIYYSSGIKAAAAGANAVTVAFSPSAAFPDIRILEYSGISTSTPVDVTAAATGTSATNNSGAATTTNASDLIVGANLVTGTTSGPGTGFIQRLLTSPDGDIAEDKLVTTAGSYNATASASGSWIMQMVAFKAAGTGGTGTAPAITSASSTAFVVGTAGSFTVTTTGTPTPSLTESGTLPSTVTFKDNGNGMATLSGTPSAGTAGSYPITITATNGVGTAATQSFTLTVNQAPAIISASNATFVAATPGSFTVNTTGVPTPSITESGTLPSGVTFKNNGNGTATLSGTPASGTAGSYPLTISATNGVGTAATQSFTLTVSGSTQAPAITSASATTFTVGGAGTFTVTTTGSPVPSLSESGALPSGVTFVDNGNGTATLSGTPASGTNATYPFTITANNGIDTAATQSFTLTVQLDPPPTTPTNLTATAVSGSQINLSWNASTDDVGVTGYLIEDCVGAGCSTFARIVTVPGTTYSVTGLTANTSYTFQVKATDAAGNFSPYSNQATTTTLTTVAGLVAAYSFDEGTGTTVNDLSGNGNVGTVVNATWTSAAKYGNALVFNGTNSIVTVPNSATLQLTNAMTLEAWVNPAVVANAWTDVIYKYPDNYYLEATSNSQKVPGGGNTVGATDSTIFGTTALTPNVWTNLTLTYDGTTLRLYVNGAQVSSVATPSGPMATSTNPLQIGGDSFHTQFFNGTIDEVRLYNVALNQTQIQSDMNTPVSSGSSLPLVSFGTPSLSFGNQATGSTSAAQQLTLSNVGGATLAISGISIAGGNAADFGETNNCPASLAPNGSCTINVTFEPLDTGTFNSFVQVSDNAPSSPQTVALSGTGTGFGVTPGVSVLTFTGTQQFTAGSGSITWSVDGVTGGSPTTGTITTNGLYTPPSVVGIHQVTATTSTQTASATVYVSNFAGDYTFHNDNMRSGQNLNETVLNLNNVNDGQFGKLFSYSLDGLSYSSPLYVANVAIPGQGNHNVVYVATEHDSVYAFDADGLSTTPLWHTSFLSTNVTSVPCGSLCSDIPKEYGVTGTPVIDPTSNTLYVVAATLVGGTTYTQTLHALDITTGAEKFGGPVVVQASVSGTASDSQGGVLKFNPFQQNQRPALLLSNGVVYLAWGSHEDSAPWHGWMMGYNATTLVQTMVYCSTANGVDGGFWATGGPATDSTGDLYSTTGNGDFTGNTGGSDFADTLLKIGTNGSVVDYFTPFNQAAMQTGNLDFSSSGPTLLVDQPGTYPHLLVAAAKLGTVYVINRDNLGKYSSNGTSDNQIVQSLVSVLPNGTQETGNYSAPVYFNGFVYFGAVSDNLKAFQLTSGMLSAGPTSESPEIFPNRGGAFSASANGTSNGIIWALQDNSPSNSVLYAYNAANLSNELYNSNQVSSRDALGLATKLVVPVVANGKVFVVGNGQLTVFGLLP
jgi:large repetitive protein